MNHQKRCAQCNKWTDGGEDYCTYCGFEHDREYKQEVAKRMKRGDPRVPVIKVHETDPLWLKVVKRPVQIVQIVLYAIIGFLIYLSTAFAH